MFYSTVLILLSATLGVRSSPIVNGNDAAANEFPFIVSLRDKDNDHFCGGSIISDRHILTANHCFDNDQEMREAIVVAGTNSQTAKPQKEVYHIEKRLSYTNWPQHKAGDHDVLILKTKEKMDITSKQTKGRKIALAKKAPAALTVATFAGWGLANVKNEPDALQKMTTKIQTDKECTDLLPVGYNPPFEMCAYAGAGKGACDGDSGGPLVYNNVLIGVALWVNEVCADNTVDTFASVAGYYPFIEYGLKNL